MYIQREYKETESRHRTITNALVHKLGKSPIIIPLSKRIPQTNVKQIGLSQRKSLNGGEGSFQLYMPGYSPYFQITKLSLSAHRELLTPCPNGQVLRKSVLLWGIRGKASETNGLGIARDLPRKPRPPLDEPAVRCAS